MERTVNRFPNAGDDVDEDETEDADEQRGLDQAFATRTPGPKMRRGEDDPLRLCMGMLAGTKDMGVGVGRENIDGEWVNPTDRSGSSWVGLGADVVETVDVGRYF